MTTRRKVRGFAIAVVALCLPMRAAAQQPARSFDQLGTQLKLGKTVFVVDANGRELKGDLREITRSSLTIDSHGPKILPADTVQLVKVKTGHRFLWGMLVGGGVGAGLALWGYSTDPGEAGPELLVIPAIGVGVGAGIAALMPARHREVYRAAPKSSGPAKIFVAPVFTRGVKGIALQFVF